MSDSFHERLKDWSAIKHQILGSYLKIFLGKVGSVSSIFYVDGFAGQGRYNDGTEGSPVLAAKLAQNPNLSGRSGILRCIFVEKKPQTFESLAVETAQFVDQGIVRNIQGDFESHLDGILKAVRGAAALFFIDPFGTDGVNVNVLKKLSDRPEITEALVRFDDTTVMRLTVCAQNNLENTDLTQRRRAQSFIRRLEGLSSEQAWIKIMEGDSDARDAIVSTYEQLVLEKTRFEYAISYPIRHPGSGAHKYFITHFTRSVYGYIHMADRMARAERSYLETQSSPPTLFAAAAPEWFGEYNADVAAPANVSAIAKRLKELATTPDWQGKSVELRWVFAQIVRDFRWRYLRTEWTKALRVLQAEGIVKNMTGTADRDTVMFSRT